MKTRSMELVLCSTLLALPMMLLSQGATEDLDDEESYDGCPYGIGWIEAAVVPDAYPYDEFSNVSWTEEIAWTPYGSYDLDMLQYSVYGRIPGQSLWDRLGTVYSDNQSGYYSYNLSGQDPRYTEFHLLSVSSTSNVCLSTVFGDPHSAMPRKKLIHNAVYLAPDEPSAGTVYFQITPLPEIEAITLSYYSESVGWIIEVNDPFVLDFDGSIGSISFSHIGDIPGDEYDDPLFYGIDVFDSSWNFLDRYRVPRLEP